MAKTNCDKDCSGRILNKEKGIYCDCIERRLPSYRSGTVRAYLMGNMDLSNLGAVESLTVKTPVDALINKLYDFGLLEYEVELVIARIVDNKPFSKITKELCFVGNNTAPYHFKKAINKLKERGYK